MDSSYEIVDRVQVDNSNKINTHEFNFVENGTRVLVIKGHGEYATKEQSALVGFDGECHCAFDGFEELETKTWKTVFDFRSYGVIGLDESTLTYGDIEKQCEGQWDFM